MKKFFLLPILAVFATLLFTACGDDDFGPAPSHGDLDYEYSPTTVHDNDTTITITTITHYGDTTSIDIDIVITDYGDTLFYNNGVIINVGDGGYFQIGNNWYYYDASTNVFVSIVVVNISQNCGCQWDSTLIDSILVIHDASLVPIALTLPEDQFAPQYFCGETGIGLIASGKIFYPWGRGSDDNQVYGSVDTVLNLGSQVWQVTNTSLMVNQTASFTVESNSAVGSLNSSFVDCAGATAPFLHGTDFLLAPQAPAANAFTWPATNAWCSFDADWNLGILYIARSIGVATDCPDHHTIRGFILLNPDDEVFDVKTQQWYTAEDFPQA